MTDKEIKKLQKKINQLKKQAEEYLNGWKRAKADYINREREIEKEKAEWIKFANKDLVLQLLPVLDSLNQSLDHIPKDIGESEWVKGVAQIKIQFEKFLQGQGIEKIKTVGEIFNPEYHEVIGKGEAGEKSKENVIVQEVQTGYMMHNKVIRTAKVIIN
ncbi:nucleotide exchange factor GrpE [Patescibacteria group bacterium AH-259-L05]|nr:nucleotide exchange factor GrpE [Patescibacteria group bacterium AH-259-L05]